MWEILATLNEEQAVRPSKIEEGGIVAGSANVGLENYITENSEVI
jgi:hypothetical protein